MKRMSNTTENRPRPNFVGSPNISLHSSEERNTSQLVQKNSEHGKHQHYNKPIFTFAKYDKQSLAFNFYRLTIWFSLQSALQSHRTARVCGSLSGGSTSTVNVPAYISLILKLSTVTQEKMCFLGNPIAPPSQTLTAKRAAPKTQNKDPKKT